MTSQTKLVAAAKEAGTIKQFMPSEFSVFGAVGELLFTATCNIVNHWPLLHW